jgi:hypothetical protein
MDTDLRMRISGEQEVITEILARIEAILRTSLCSEQRALGRERRRLAGSLSTHLGWMEAEVYPMLLAHQGRCHGEIVARMRTEGRSRALTFRTHLARWHAETVSHDWEGYRAVMSAEIRLIRAHLEHSRRHLQPLLDRMLPLSDAA